MSTKPSLKKKFKKVTTKQDDNRIPVDNSEFYGLVISGVGNMMFKVKDTSGNVYIAKLKSAIKRQNRITAGKIVLLENILNLYEIVHCYSDEKTKELQKMFSDDEIEDDEIMFTNNSSETEDEFDIENI